MGCDMGKDNGSAKTPKQIKSNSGQRDEKPTYSSDKTRQWLHEIAKEPVADKKRTLYDELLEIKDDIAAVYPSRLSADRLVKGLRDNGLDITLKTFRTYWQRINREEKKEVVSEPENSGKNDPVPDEKPDSFLENSDGENSAGSEPENVQDQTPEATENPALVCQCGTPMTLRTANGGGKFWKCPNAQGRDDKEHDFKWIG